MAVVKTQGVWERELAVEKVLHIPNPVRPMLRATYTPYHCKKLHLPSLLPSPSFSAKRSRLSVPASHCWRAVTSTSFSAVTCLSCSSAEMAGSSPPSLPSMRLSGTLLRKRRSTSSGVILAISTMWYHEQLTGQQLLVLCSPPRPGLAGREPRI